MCVCVCPLPSCDRSEALGLTEAARYRTAVASPCSRVHVHPSIHPLIHPSNHPPTYLHLSLCVFVALGVCLSVSVFVWSPQQERRMLCQKGAYVRVVGQLRDYQVRGVRQ